MVHNPQENAEPPGRVFLSVKGKVPEGIPKGPPLWGCQGVAAFATGVAPGPGS